MKYTSKEAAIELNVSERRIQEMAKSGRLKASKFAGRWQITQESIDAVRDRKPGRAGWQKK